MDATSELKSAALEQPDTVTPVAASELIVAGLRCAARVVSLLGARRLHLDSSRSACTSPSQTDTTTLCSASRRASATGTCDR